MDGVHRQLTVIALVGGAALSGGITACGRDAARARVQAAGVVDSIVPQGEALARFRKGLPEVDRLTGGAPSRDALVQRFVTALARGDTATLGDLLLTRAEFAWLYYPTNPQGLPPYSLPPGLMWDMHALQSAKGLRRALADFGGRPLGYAGYACDPDVSRQGQNVVAGPCTIRVGVGGTDTLRLFGLIVERGGRHKFVSYANKL
jgi:hypothetical protein